MIPIQIFSTCRIQNWIEKEGITTFGIVSKSKLRSNKAPYIPTEFYHNGLNYDSFLTVSDTIEFKNIKIKDSVLIRFIKKYPKMNRTEKLLKKRPFK